MNYHPAVSTPLQSPSAEHPCRIWVLEDHAAISQLLTDFIAGEPAYRVAGASANSEPLLAACARGEVDLVLLDLMLEGIGGLRVLDELNRFEPRPKVVVFSATVTQHTVKTALSWGVQGYVEKAAPLEELHAAIARAASGGVFLSRRVSAITRRLIEQRNPKLEDAALSPRELRVLELLARGVTTKEIARELSLSEPATYRVKNAISAKLQAWSDPELTLQALRMGLIGALESDQGPNLS